MGAVIVIVPVVIIQSGCITVAVGASGRPVRAIIVILVAGEIQLPPLLTVKEYVPGFNPENVILPE